MTSPLTMHSHTTSPICSLCSRPTTHSNQTSGTANASITGAHISFTNLTTTRSLIHFNIHNKNTPLNWLYMPSHLRSPAPDAVVGHKADMCLSHAYFSALALYIVAPATLSVTNGEHVETPLPWGIFEIATMSMWCRML